MEKELRVIISGGGTGGHIFPAISIANAIKEARPQASILFVGAEGKMEMEKVPAAGYEIKGIPARGLKRPLYSLSNISVAIDYLKCRSIAKRIIKEFKPHLIVGVGGYASAAIVGMGAKCGIPVLLQEQNSFAGLVNRKNGSSASKICVAYDGMERFFPAEKIILTGNPIRKDIRKATPQQKEEGFAFYNFSPEKKTLFVVGGSLGCRTLNECMKRAITSSDLFKPVEEGGKGYQAIWQCGKIYKEEVMQFLQQNPAPNVYCSDFIQRMDLAYAVANVVVSRAGAGTISELCTAGKCTVFVPSPVVAEDHQTHNAMALVEKDAALMITDAKAVNEFVPCIAGLLEDSERISRLEENILKLAKPDAAAVIAQECLELAEK